MSPREEIPDVPDVNDLARSILVMYGAHDDDEHGAEAPPDPYARTPRFPIDAQRYELIRAATERDSDRYLNSGLAPVECRRCGAQVEVKKLGPAYTAVQWNSTSMNRCAYFAEHGSTGTRGCPHLNQSIKHAVAEGLLEETCSAAPPGDGD